MAVLGNPTDTAELSVALCRACAFADPSAFAHVLPDPPSLLCWQECSLVGPELPEGKWLWHGGTFTPDRRYLYAFPNHADQVLKIDTLTDEVTLIGGPDVIKSGRHRVPQDGRYKYLGGAYVPGNNCVYCFPCDAERVLKINCDTDEVSVVGRELLQAPGTSWNGMNKWQNGFYSDRDGCVYAVPQRADGVLRVVPATKENGALQPRTDGRAALCPCIFPESVLHARFCGRSACPRSRRRLCGRAGLWRRVQGVQGKVRRRRAKPPGASVQRVFRRAR